MHTYGVIRVEADLTHLRWQSPSQRTTCIEVNACNSSARSSSAALCCNSMVDDRLQDAAVLTRSYINKRNNLRYMLGEDCDIGSQLAVIVEQGADLTMRLTDGVSFHQRSLDTRP